MKLKDSFWDDMAQHYPHYNDPSMQKDVEFVLSWAQKHGVDFKERLVLDIGCGTGTVAIPLALRGARVDAIDLSQAMLTILQEDVSKLHLEKLVKSYKSDWDSFHVSSLYDIVFASMTPAISQEYHIQKMINATSKIGIYVGWGAYKINDFVDQLMLEHAVQWDKKGGCVKVTSFMEYLDHVGLPYHYEYFKTSWDEAYSIEQATAYALNQLSRKEVTPDMKKIHSLIDRFTQEDGSIKIGTRAEKGIVLFSK